ncbi:hypothetical protein EUX98_g3154 [Antrodiella citrinella]|uniref:Uncharacterized protein n=1 Tax=Antrodiella citrinella TaxID=2447956 RepID=A0A4S4MX78_9APHY|nr:hypothetical protein EUX98_g3154 [Antrodiella citrinella]
MQSDSYPYARSSSPLFSRTSSPFLRDEDNRHRPYHLESRARNVSDGLSSAPSSDYIRGISAEDLKRNGNPAYLSLLDRYTSLRSDYEHEKRTFNHLEQRLRTTEGEQAQLKESYEKLLAVVGSHMAVTKQSTGNTSSSVNPTLQLSTIAQQADQTVLRREDHKHVRFWTKLEWNKHTTGAGGVTNPQDAAPNGPKKALNKKLHFIQRSDGSTISEEDAENMRGFSKSIWFSFLTYCSKAMPPTWLQAPLELRQHFNREMTAQFPDLRLCDSNWKVTEFASIYYAMWRPRFGDSDTDGESVSRKRSKSATPFLGKKRVRLETPAVNVASPGDSIDKDESSSPDNAASSLEAIIIHDPLANLFNETGSSSSRPSTSNSNTPASASPSDHVSTTVPALLYPSSPDLDSPAPASSSSAATSHSPITSRSPTTATSSLPPSSLDPGRPGSSSNAPAGTSLTSDISSAAARLTTTDSAKATPSSRTEEDAPATSTSKGVPMTDDANAIAKPKGKIMKPLPNCQTPRNRCAEDWCRKNKGGLAADFKAYWDKMPVNERASWEREKKKRARGSKAHDNCRTGNISNGPSSTPSSDYIRGLSGEELKQHDNSAYLSLLDRYTSLRRDYEQKRAFNHTEQQLRTTEGKQAQLSESYDFQHPFFRQPDFTTIYDCATWENMPVEERASWEREKRNEHAVRKHM